MFNKVKRLIIILIITLVILCTIPFINKEPLQVDFPQPNVDDDNGDNLVKLIVDPHDALIKRLSAINNAKKSIYICTYNIAVNDESAQLIIAGLIKAAQNGVNVYLITDGKFGGLNRNYIKLLSMYNNIQVLLYNKLNFKYPESVQVSLHNKIMLFDDEWIISGGRNISDTFLTNDKLAKPISYDLDVLIYNHDHQSQVINDVKYFFNELITCEYCSKVYKNPNFESKQLAVKLLSNYDKYINEQKLELSNSLHNTINEMHKAKNITLLTNSLIPIKKEANIATSLLNICKQHKSELTIFTPYLIMNDNIQQAFNTLSNNRQVTVLTNSIKTSPNYPAFSNYLHNRKNILKLNMNVFEYTGHKNTSIHTKAAIIGDNLTTIGSMNLDNRSLYINTEQMLIMNSEGFQEEMNKVIAKQKEVSTQILSDKQSIEGVSKFKKLVMRISKYIFLPFKYFL